MQAKLVATLHCFGEPYFAEFTPDGKLLAVGDNLKAVTLRETATWKIVRSVKIDDIARSIAFSKYNHVMAVGTAWDPAVQIWDTHSWKQRSRTAHLEEINSVSLDNAGRLTASCGMFDKMFYVRDVQKNTNVFSAPSGKHKVGSVVLSPDGIFLAAAVDRQVWVWETRHWKVVHKIPSGGKEYFHALAFTSDSKMLACSGGYERGLLILTECGSWKTRFSLRGDYGFMEHLCFSPQNKLLASASASSEKGGIRLWESAKGALVQEVPRIGKSLTDLSFHPTKNLLASACNDGTVSIFSLADA